MSELLLSSLCAICHGNPHRYKCPKCGILTCCMPCVKRHKKWAQCNGVRDPAAYVRISSLATPAGLDRDYNYLTSIEREFDRADAEAEERGFGLEGAASAGKKGFAKGESNVINAQKRCAVTVTRAPKGMSRSQSNKTRWLKKDKCLDWTIEWVGVEGQRSVVQCKETSSLADAYTHTLEPTKAGSSVDIGQIPHIYLHIPSVPWRQKVLATVDPQTKLKDVVHGRHVLEYPTFHLFPSPTLPPQYILEEDYFKVTQAKSKSASQTVVDPPPIRHPHEPLVLPSASHPASDLPVETGPVRPLIKVLEVD